MKKTLLALAAIGAFAGAAQAQSSVTVYGTLDASMGRVDTGATTTNGITTKVVGSAMTSDRLGFKGVEDLGGGKTARFQIETGLAPFSHNTGEVGSGSGNVMTQDTPGSLIANRRPTFIGITDKTLGAIDAGSLYSLGFLFTGYGDVAGNNTLGTNFSQATVVTGVGDNNNTATTIGGTTSAFKLNSNAVQYTSPTISGVTARIYNVTNSGSANGAGKVTAADVNYVLGKFNAGAVYEVKTVRSNSPASKHTSMGIGAGYDFGAINTRVTYQKGTLDIDTAGVKSPSATVTVTKFTAIAPVGPAIDIFGGYVILTENNQGTMYSASTSDAGKATAMNIGAQYKFSKRTNVYAYYTTLDNDANSSFGLTTKVGTANLDPNTLAIGMRHSF
jgi:predicted porin